MTTKNILVVVFYFCVVVILYTLSRSSCGYALARKYCFCNLCVQYIYAEWEFQLHCTLNRNFCLKILQCVFRCRYPHLLLRYWSSTIFMVNICLHRRWDTFQVIVVCYSSMLNVFQEGIICLKSVIKNLILLYWNIVKPILGSSSYMWYSLSEDC